MAEMSPGTALRRAPAGAGRPEEGARALEAGQGQPGESRPRSSTAGWESLTQAHRLMAAIPADGGRRRRADQAARRRAVRDGPAGPAAPAQAARSDRIRRPDDDDDGSTTRTARIDRHGAPEDPPPGRSRPRPGRRPRPQPDAGRTVADDGDPRRGHPSRSSIARWSKGPVGAAAPNHGDLVRVVDRDGQHARLRPLERPVADQPAVPVAPGRRRRARSSGAAGSTRPSPCGRTLLGLDRETNAYRVVHAEGDGLSGLIVDRFDDVLSVEVFSLGMYQRIGPILSLLRRAAGHGAFPRRRRRAGRACRRTSRAGRWPARSSRPA